MNVFGLVLGLASALYVTAAVAAHETTSADCDFWACEKRARLPLIRNADGNWVFGDERLSVHVDGHTGIPNCYCVRGIAMLVQDDLPCPVISFGGNPLESLPQSENVFCADDDTVCSVFRIDKWKCLLYVRLYPGSTMVRCRMEFEWCGAEKRKFTDFRMIVGKVRCSNGRGRYVLPCEFPPSVHERSSFKAGRTVRSDGNVSAAVADDGDGRSYMVCLGDMEPYSDRGAVGINERGDGFAIEAGFSAAGYAIPDCRQVVGDVWMRFGTGTAEAELDRMHEWHRLAGYMPPADRPDRIRDLVVYSMHPKGRSDSGGADVGGFRHAKRYLPFLRSLGINCIWMRPVYHAGGYRPDRMYEMQEGVGSESDELDYVRSAHELGMEVWGDAVPHGGKTSNERTKRHPEWVCRKEDGSFQRDYWAYDLNWPTWVKYFSDWVEWYTRKYGLDGWRMDVPTGAKFPNWNPDIPYLRASYAQRQGGIAQQKAIRAAARRVNPNAVTLGEENGACWATVADIIYDQMLCHAHFHGFRERDAKSIVNDLRMWLHQQRLAYPPGTVWLRYPESHDSKLAVNLWGQACANALMALSAWIDGVPMVCQGGEVGAFEAWRHIFAVRAALPELRRGDVDYISASAPDGVFVCTRKLNDLESAVIVNFNDVRVRGKAAGVSIDLPPYGYEVRRLKGPSVEKALSGMNPYVPPEKSLFRASGRESGLVVCEGVVAELRNLTNGVLVAESELSAVKTADGVRIGLKTGSSVDATNVRLVLRFDGAERWFAHAAEGSFDSPFFVSHPGLYEKVKCWMACNGGRFVDPEVCWSNYSHPFGMNLENAEVGALLPDVAIGVGGFRPGALVELRDRLGDENGLAVTISGTVTEDLSCCVRLLPMAGAIARREPASGDVRLRPTAGGWMYDDGAIRIRFSNSGAIIAAWMKRGDSWREALGYCGWYGLKTSDFISALGWGAREQKVARQDYDCYGRVVISRDESGNLVVEFSDIRPAMFGRQYLSEALSCRARYVLGGGKMSAEVAFHLEPGKLKVGDVGKWEYHVTMCGDLRSEVGKTVVSGVKPVSETSENGLARWVFIDGAKSAYVDGGGTSLLYWSFCSEDPILNKCL